MSIHRNLNQRLTLYAVFALAVFVVTGTVCAGNVDSSGPQSPMMKTLDQIPPSWSQKLPATERFTVVLNGAAVLDRETGLVWERSPSPNLMLWSNAFNSCQAKEVGGRLGWRMPRLEELQSLVDRTRSNPSLPAGHPFSNVQSSPYWSTYLYLTYAGYVDFSTGITPGSLNMCDGAYIWCVRGGTSPVYLFQEPLCTN
jgi:hypothetical protein